MLNDPIVEEIYMQSAEVAARFNYDVHALCQYYRDQQQLENRPVVSRPPRLCRKRQPTVEEAITEAYLLGQISREQALTELGTDTLAQVEYQRDALTRDVEWGLANE